MGKIPILEQMSLLIHWIIAYSENEGREGIRMVEVCVLSQNLYETGK